MRYLFASSLFLALAACLTPGLEAQSKGLVAHWTFDDPTNPLLDVVGGHQGTFKGGAIVSKTNMPPLPGNAGALELPKDGAYVGIPQHADFNFAPKEPMSYALWLRLTKLKSIYHVWANRAGCGGAIHYQVFRTDAKAGLRLRSGTVSNGASVGEPPINQWTHFAVTFDGTDLLLYLDGVQTGKQSGFSFQSNSSTADLVIGHAGSCPTRQTFVGLIDDFRLYNRALTQAEIALLARSWPASFTPYGKSCGPVLAASSGSRPIIGTSFMMVTSNLPTSATAALMCVGASNKFFGSIPLPLNLDFMGMVGCFLHQSFDNQWVFSVASGTGQFGGPVPNLATLLGQTMYFQAAAGLVTSNGGEVLIGNK